jgi:vacuolar protein sorting-associated protein 13A/C
LHELIAVKKLEQGAKEQMDEEKEGFLVNMLTRIVDNLQIQIKGIHVRYEDVMFGKEPLSMGITLEKFQAKTTNEKWEPEFIDRTQAANKYKPLQKHIELSNVGLYCKPRDSRQQMISMIEDQSERLARFKSMFGEDEQLCAEYDACYILRPISIEARAKQLSSH